MQFKLVFLSGRLVDNGKVNVGNVYKSIILHRMQQFLAHLKEPI